MHARLPVTILMSDRAARLLEVRDLSVAYRVQRSAWAWPRILRAVCNVSFDLAAGETLGIVGESGCGKSTLARAITGLVPASGGSISWHGRALAEHAGAERRAVRRDMQMVFQDPCASLDPRMSVADIVAEPLEVFENALSRQERERRVARILERVGLSATHLGRLPHQLSGGQCQRVAIARALILGPRLLICDEPVSSLDVSVQAQIVNLLRDLQRELGLSLIFISHNMAVVRQVSARVLVMYLGRVMELGARDAVFDHPRHPYTRVLLAAVPANAPQAAPRRAARPLSAEIPSPLDPPPGCVFNTRCAWAVEQCRLQLPTMEQANAQVTAHASLQAVACHRWREL